MQRSPFPDLQFLFMGIKKIFYKPTYYTKTSIQHDYTVERASTNRIVPNSLITTVKSFLNKQWKISNYQYAHLFDKDKFMGVFLWIIIFYSKHFVKVGIDQWLS